MQERKVFEAWNGELFNSEETCREFEEVIQESTEQVKAALLEEWEVNKDDEEWYYYIEKMDFKKFLKFIENCKTVSKYMKREEGICEQKEGNYVFKDYEMYNRYADLRKKCKRKPDYDFW